ncbi:MAG: hypothetical protein GYB30_07720 [Gammaproteobacteria bacterium]|jgi:hypothetical protein|nr:hypothetical protein [Gammaproteobacteria bacterium]
MKSRDEQALQQRWHKHVDEQANTIELAWQQIAPKPQPISQRLWWLATAAALVVAVTYLGWQQQPPSPARSVATNLEQPMLLADNYRLTQLDKQIQLALLRGADTATLDSLWQQRAQLTSPQALQATQ